MSQDPNTELFAQYEEKIKASGIANDSPDYKKLVDEFWAAPDKAKVVADYGTSKPQPTADEKTMRFDELTEIPADLKWKEEYDKYFMKHANEEERPFIRIDKRTDTSLDYRAGESYASFVSAHHGQIESDNYKDFVIMCKTSLDAGHTHAELGEFKQHPEYRAKFVLACLETGLKITNMPELESLKTYPEFAKIVSHFPDYKAPEQPAPAEPEKTAEPEKATDPKAEIRKKVLEANKKLQQAQADADADKAPGGYVEKKKAVDNAKKAYNKDKSNQDLKKAQNEAYNAMDATATGAALKSAKSAYEAAMKEAVQQYIDHGEIESKKRQQDHS